MLCILLLPSQIGMVKIPQIKRTVRKPLTSRKIYEKTMIMEATAYCTGCDGVGTKTASGTRIRQGVVAVDPKMIKLGTWLYIEGYGFAQALDTGGAIKGNRIDLFMESCSEAKKWGRRKVKVILFEKR